MTVSAVSMFLKQRRVYRIILTHSIPPCIRFTSGLPRIDSLEVVPIAEVRLCTRNVHTIGGIYSQRRIPARGSLVLYILVA